MSTTKATSSAFYQRNSKSFNQTRINQDEAEAGSILVALANHNHLTQNTKSMSINNLLESNDQNRKKSTAFTEHYRAVSQGNGRILRESADGQYPATPPPTHYTYKNEPYNHERMHSSPEVYNMQHQQNNAYVTHPPHIAKGKSTTGTGHVYAHHHNLKHQQQQQQQHQQSNRHHPHVYAPPSQSSNDFSRQYTNMKQNPKIKRNALQAYISYMTYTDIARKRVKQGPTMMHQQHEKPNLPPASRYTAAPPPPSNYQQPLASPPYPQQRRYHNSMISPPNQHHPYQLKPTNNKRYQPSLQVPMSPPSPKLIVEQPLTAFLYHQRGPPPQTRRDLR